MNLRQKIEQNRTISDNNNNNDVIIKPVPMEIFLKCLKDIEYTFEKEEKHKIKVFMTRILKELTFNFRQKKEMNTKKYWNFGSNFINFQFFVDQLLIALISQHVEELRETFLNYIEQTCQDMEFDTMDVFTFAKEDIIYLTQFPSCGQELNK
jgi:hypothetical protein